MTRTRWTIEDVPENMSWVDLHDFVTHLPDDSALLREQYPEHLLYGHPMFTQAILMDIYDKLAGFDYSWVYAHRRKGANIPEPEPYPRPWVKRESPKAERIGSDPIPRDKFDEWWESKNQ